MYILALAKGYKIATYEVCTTIHAIIIQIIIRHSKEVADFVLYCMQVFYLTGGRLFT